MAARRKSRRVVLNVAGEIFETFDKTLTRFPTTLLGDYEKREVFYCKFSGQYYIKRSLLGRLCFDSILYFYQSNGSLVCPPEIPLDVFKEECQFFQLPNEDVEKMVQKKNRCVFHLDDIELPDGSDKNKPIGAKIWDFLEHPGTSTSAKLFAFFSFFVVFLSVVTSSLETIPALHYEGIDLSNHWISIDLAINIWFLMEFVARAVFCRSKLNFVKGTENWLDCVAVVPYFLLLLSSEKGLHQVYHHRYLRIPRFVRIFRLLRLSKYSRRIRVVEEIIKASAKDLQLLLLCALVVVTFSGSIAFVVEEHHNPKNFQSTPQSLWWAVQTLTTVGYGDVIPITLTGKLIATCLMVFGAGTMTLPILGIVTKFVSAYSHLQGTACDEKSPGNSDDIRISGFDD